jgi:hypothetical protein
MTNNIPKYIQENMGQWVKIVGNNTSSVGILENFTWNDGFTLRPSVISESRLSNDGKNDIPMYRLERERPTGVPYGGQVVYPWTEQRVNDFLNLNKNLKLEDRQLNLF